MTALAAASQTNLDHIRELEAARDRIRTQIESIQKRLKDLERFKDPDSLPYITFKTVTKIEELAAPRVPLRNALRDDIRKLQEQARAVQLELQAAKLRQQAPPVKPGPVLVQPAGQVKQGGGAVKQSVPIATSKPAPVQPTPVPPNPQLQGFDNSLTQAIDVLNGDASLDNAGKVLEAMRKVALVGGDDSRGYTALKKAGEKLQDEGIKAVNSSPTPHFDDMHDLLEAMKLLSLTGGDTQRGWATLGTAAGKRVKFAVSMLHDDCKPENVRMVLMTSKEAALLGNELAVQAGMTAVSNATVSMRKKSEVEFRKAPTMDNFHDFMDLMRQEQLVAGTEFELDNPKGLPHLPSGIVHTVRPTETLQDISRRYYGSPGFWDVIVFRNFEKFRGLPDPTKVSPGMILRIS